MALYTSELPLAQKPWRVTMKPKGQQAHGSHPACHAWREGENGFPGKPGKEWKLSEGLSFLSLEVKEI